MEITITREKKYSIIVNEVELRTLVNFLFAQYSAIKIVARCNDGSTINTSELEDIINFENSKTRKIENLDLNFGKSYESGGIVEFFGDRIFTSCRFTVREDDDAKALKVSKEIEHRLDECKTWYSFLRRFSLSLILLAIYLLFRISYLWFQVATSSYKSSPQISVLDLFNITALIIPFLLLFFLGIYYLEKAWNWMFPKVWFDIGKQKTELQKRVKIRGWIFGGVIVTLVLGIVASIIATLITNQLPR